MFLAFCDVMCVYCVCSNTLKVDLLETLCSSDCNKEMSKWSRLSCVSVCVFPGCGEHLIRTMLARECSAAMQSEDAHQALLDAMQNKFISESPTCSPTATPFQTHRCVGRDCACEKHSYASGELSLRTDVA